MEISNIDNCDSSCESHSSFVPLMRRFAELFFHSLTRVVRPRIKKKRLCDSISACVLSFLRLTYGLTARRQELRDIGKQYALRGYPVISLVTGGKQFRSDKLTSFNYKINPSPRHPRVRNFSKIINISCIFILAFIMSFTICRKMCVSIQILDNI